MAYSLSGKKITGIKDAIQLAKNIKKSKPVRKSDKVAPASNQELTG